MPKTPIFIGIDPGTRAAYAILDIDGNLIKVDSSKDLGLSQLIDRIISKGLPIAVGTDKAKLPDLIEKFAAQTGCKIVIPLYDLKIEEKKDLAKEYKYNDIHQMDALASAIHAFNFHSNKVRKIKHYVEENSKEQILNDLIIYVIKEELSIKNALELIEGKDEETKIIKKVIEERNFGKKDFLKIYDKLHLTKKDNSLLREYNLELKNTIKELESELSLLIKKQDKRQALDSKRISDLFSYKEKRISELRKKIDTKNEKIEELINELEKANSFISKLNNVYLLKKLRNLGIKEFEKKKTELNISKGDMLLVDDINVYNEKTLGLIKGRVNFILCRNQPNNKTKNELKFELISSGDVQLEEFGNFAIVKKELIDRMLKKKNILNKVIEEYKESRR